MLLQNEKNIEKRLARVELACTTLRDENKEIRKELGSLKRQQQDDEEEKEDKSKSKKKKVTEAPVESKHQQPLPINNCIPSAQPMPQQLAVPPVMWAPIMYPYYQH